MTDTKALEKTKREILREKMFSNKNRKSKTITVFDEKMEIRQPSLGALMDAKEEDNNKLTTARMLINYCYVPGTNEKVFEDADVDAILNMPFGEALMTIQNAITEMTGVNIKEEEKNLSETLIVT